MTIKEMEQMLGIPRATIRFYEKQGLISPKRENNTYRDYSEEDLALLKRIVIFRKLGFPVQDIENIFDGSRELPEAMEEQIKSLEKQIDELSGALEVCQMIRKRRENLESFDENLYWEEIRREEKRGSRFLDITGDFLQYEKENMEETFRARDEEGEFRHSRKNVWVKIVALTVLCGCMAGVLENFRIQAALKGVMAPVLFVVLLTIFEVPAYICKEKYPRAEKWLLKTGYWIAVIAMFAYMLGFFYSVWNALPLPLRTELIQEPALLRQFISGEGEGGEHFFSVLQFFVGAGIAIWGYICHILERRLIFDRRHVTGVNGFYIIVVGGTILGIPVYEFSPNACVGMILLIIIIYQLINHFVEEKQYSEEERYRKPE